MEQIERAFAGLSDEERLHAESRLHALIEGQCEGSCLTVVLPNDIVKIVFESLFERGVLRGIKRAKTKGKP